MTLQVSKCAVIGGLILLLASCSGSTGTIESKNPWDSATWADSTKGIIGGRVRDKKTGEPIPQVPISVKGTMLGVLTDEDGKFVISNINPDIHTVSVIFVGYKRLELPEVQVTEGEVTILEIELEEQPWEFEPAYIY